ncbi:MAG: hypothetical protein DRJ65_00050 [Acidobacteria bacterium]|nr:MAG: hypothetical protein DRJ65_00050 [Acidobacteriota bacterium]
MAVDDKPRPDTPSIAYKNMVDEWQLVRDLLGSTPAMWDAGTRWLPQWVKETATQYSTRLKKTTLFNGLGRTIKVLTGKVFRKPVETSENMPKLIREWLVDVDLEGNSVDTFSRKVFSDALAMGLSHVFVDHPYSDAVSAADEIGLRPYLVHVPADHLVAWSHTTSQGRKTLASIRILDSVIVPDGVFGEKSVDRVREYFMGAEGVMEYRFWLKDDDGDWIVSGSGTTSRTSIPLVTFYTQEVGPMQGVPPLRDLAYTNLAHWQSVSEQRHCMTIGRKPFPFFKGFGPDFTSVEVGPFSGPKTENDKADVKIIESNGLAIASGRQELLDLKEEMAVMGAELLVRKPVKKTATETISENDETNSDLGAMVSGVEDSMNNVLIIMGEWKGIKNPGTLKYNRDFGIAPNASAEVDSLIKMRGARLISRALFFTGLQSRGFIGEGWDLDTEVAAMAAEADF